MRSCCLIFDYDRDLARARAVAATKAARVQAPVSLDDWGHWQKLITDPPQLRASIDKALEHTSVTVVLIGERTAGLDYVTYAIERSIARENGLLGLFVHAIEDENGNVGQRGRIPYEAEARQKLPKGYAAHDWDPAKFREWVNDAATDWRAYARPEPLNKARA